MNTSTTWDGEINGRQYHAEKTSDFHYVLYHNDVICGVIDVDPRYLRVSCEVYDQDHAGTFSQVITALQKRLSYPKLHTVERLM